MHFKIFISFACFFDFLYIEKKSLFLNHFMLHNTLLWRREWQPTPVFLPGESHGQRSLVGYSPRGSQRVKYNWVTNPIPYYRCFFDCQSSKIQYPVMFPVLLSDIVGIHLSLSHYSCFLCNFSSISCYTLRHFSQFLIILLQTYVIFPAFLPPYPLGHSLSRWNPRPCPYQ